MLSITLVIQRYISGRRIVVRGHLTIVVRGHLTIVVRGHLAIVVHRHLAIVGLLLLLQDWNL